jgi:hypothetical protein
MKFRLIPGLSVALYAVIANALYWLVFAILFAVGSYAYQPHRPRFEEITAAYVFFGRALKLLDTSTGIGLPPLFLRVTYSVQWPSVYAAGPFFWYFNRHNISVDHQYFGTSVGGYFLLLVCLISFLQWYLMGWMVQKLLNSWRRRSNATPGQLSRRVAEP